MYAFLSDEWMKAAHQIRLARSGPAPGGPGSLDQPGDHRRPVRRRHGPRLHRHQQRRVGVRAGRARRTRRRDDDRLPDGASTVRRPRSGNRHAGVHGRQDPGPGRHDEADGAADGGSRLATSSDQVAEEIAAITTSADAAESLHRLVEPSSCQRVGCLDRFARRSTTAPAGAPCHPARRTSHR